MTENLEQFVSAERGFMARLYIAGGVKYATDNATLAWLDTDADDEIDHWTPELTPSKLIADRKAMAGKYEPFKMPAYTPIVVACRECGGSGRIPEFTKCDECGGSGEVECDYGHDHECPECSGRGKFANDNHGPCKACAATGKVNDPTQILTVSGVTLSAVRLAKLAAWLPEGATCAKAGDGVIFAFDGGGALIMQMDG